MSEQERLTAANTKLERDIVMLKLGSWALVVGFVLFACWWLS